MLLIIFELFRLQYPEYHDDFYTQLRGILKELPSELVNHPKMLVAEIMSHYYQCSLSRFRFAQKFISYLDDLI